MTKEEARIIILEDSLMQAQNMIDFMHNCLINPQYYRYEYPTQTLEKLKELDELVPRQSGVCHHSFTKEDCEACQVRNKRLTVLLEAKEVLYPA